MQLYFACFLFFVAVKARLELPWDTRPGEPLVIGPYWHALIEQDMLKHPSDYASDKSRSTSKNHQNRVILPLTADFTCNGGVLSCGVSTADGSVPASPSGSLTYLFVSTSGGPSGIGQCCSAGGVNGATITSANFPRSTGQVLNFYFNYVTSDGATFNDYASCSLFTGGGSFVALLFTARTAASGDTVPGAGLGAISAITVPSNNPIIPGAPTWAPLGTSSGTCWSAGCGTTGWIFASYTFSTSGIFYVQCGVTNTQDTAFDSGLALDFAVPNGISIDFIATE
jgi:hypothetical protein